MAFTLPDDLAPELYPLAWLAGTWRGYGILTYGETVPEQAVYQEMTFDHDGGPYLRQTTTIWTVDATRSKNLDFEMPGLQGASLLAPAQIWSTETTYWRPVGQEQPDDADTKGSGGPLTPVTRLELVSADPAGHVAVWEGWIQGPRAHVGTQAVGRARTAVPVEEMTRMFGLVGGDLMWTQDMAAFGQSEVTTYASGRLGRVDDVNDPAAQPGSALDPAESAEESSTSSAPASDDAEPNV
ncbi:FABP family protein [Actinomyces oris]|uniref:FABP family protein n=1 Tax=Actinomyces oris TaxID=544580 RepID=A0AAW9KMK7_9ACTO|nr:FABP family protein [Actinomyces oris]MEA1305681.1 FABP family protein [Actinomyces oris]OLO63570.1 FABP family protein [Actinomyces oris]